MLDHNGNPINVGDRVEHFARNSMPEYVGVVVGMPEDQLPLIQVEIQGEVRRLPHFDLIPAA